jgi:hypothetical protein
MLIINFKSDRLFAYSWLCSPLDDDLLQLRLCRKLHREWFRTRSSLEKSWGRSGLGPSSFKTDLYFGYCNEYGEKGYSNILVPER